MIEEIKWMHEAALAEEGSCILAEIIAVQRWEA